MSLSWEEDPEIERAWRERKEQLRQAKAAPKKRGTKKRKFRPQSQAALDSTRNINQERVLPKAQKAMRAGAHEAAQNPHNLHDGYRPSPRNKT